MRNALTGLLLICSLWIAMAQEVSAQCDVRVPGVGTSGPAGFYPLTRQIANMPGTISSMSVVVPNLTHTYPSDLQLLLVGPGGQKVLLMAGCGGSADITNFVIRFSDTGIPNGSEALLDDESYAPTSNGFSGDLPTPAPAGPYGSTLSVFEGTNPNGTWSLYVNDSTTGDVGCIDEFYLAFSLNGASCPLSVTPRLTSLAYGASNANYNITALSACSSSLISTESWAYPIVSNIGTGNFSTTFRAKTNTSRKNKLAVLSNNNQQSLLIKRNAQDSYFHQKTSEDLCSAALQPVGSQDGWSIIGINTAGLATTALDSASGSYSARTFTHPTKQRVTGAVQNKNLWLPFSTVGSNAIGRGKFYVFGQDLGSNAMPNLRMRMSVRFAVNSMLEVFHSVNDTAAQQAMSAELRPSTDSGFPSLYRVDLRAFRPTAANAAGEGLLAGFEAFADLPQSNGTIQLTEYEAGFYDRQLLSTFNMPNYQYIPTPSDAGNLKVYNPAAELAISNLIAGATEGDPPTVDSGAPGGQLGTHTESGAGVTLGTLNVPSNRIGVVTRNFNPGLGGNNFTQRMRVAEREQYSVSFFLTSTQQAALQPQVRMRARAIKFSWSQKYEIGGAFSAGATSNLIAQQTLPGTGTQYPGATAYLLIMHSPMSNDIRSEYPPQAPFSARMPLINAQPRSGVDASSRRDLFVGLDLLDTISGGANAGLEAGQVLCEAISIVAFETVDD